MQDLNLVWPQTSLDRVWFESCQCPDECYRKNKNLFKELFVCLFKRWLLPNVKKVGALWAVISFPSNPDVLLELRILSTWFLLCLISAEQSLHFCWIMWWFLIRMNGKQRLRVDFCACITLLHVCHSGAAYWVSDLFQVDSVSKWHELRDRRFLKVPGTEEQHTVLPPKVLHGCSGFLSLHLVFDYIAKLDFFQDLVSVIDFITLCFINPTLPALCSLVLFSQAGQFCGSHIHQQNYCNLWTSSAVKICVYMWGVCGVFLT